MGRCIYLRKGEVHTPPVVGIKASDLPIGWIVKLMEGGVETEFIAVNQGIPGNSSLYDASCNGTWLLRKKLLQTRQWNTTNVNDYSNSTINAWLNGEYFNSLGTAEQKAVYQVKIPYMNGAGSSAGTPVASGADGLSVKAFLLGGYEIGAGAIIPDNAPVDGAKLDYFVSNDSRIAYLYGNGADIAQAWWTRSGNKIGAVKVIAPGASGYPQSTSYNCTDSICPRPALIIPSTSIFDPTTYLLKK